MNAAAILILGVLVLNAAELKIAWARDPSPRRARVGNLPVRCGRRPKSGDVGAPVWCTGLAVFRESPRPGGLNEVADLRIGAHGDPGALLYSQRPTTLSVHVDFHKGLITEWYPSGVQGGPSPSAAVGPLYRNGSVQWDEVSVLPGAQPDFPSTSRASRYYTARQTDSAPLSIGAQPKKLSSTAALGAFCPPFGPGAEVMGRSRSATRGLIRFRWRSSLKTTAEG